ncbi:MAG: lipoyl synthase [Desulfuromonadaceae bacterium]|nr:lipoyl synthase [Desulfuromonadaceae bacterium]
MKTHPADIEIIDLGIMEYQDCFEIQKRFVQERIADNAPDRLLIVSHPPVITIGKSGNFSDIYVSEEFLRQKGIQVCRSDRGGKTTFHGPGQFVAYPILKLSNKDVHWYVQTLLNVISSVLMDLKLKPELRPGMPGVWVNNGKIASIGIAVKKWVAYHGIALNVNEDVSNFNLINPCGIPGQTITSINNERGEQQNSEHIKQNIVKNFKKSFGYSRAENERHPNWLRIPAQRDSDTNAVTELAQSLHLETVCQRAQCPNLGECFSKGTATFMILGRYCTRNCRFCAVEHGTPVSPDPDEPGRVAKAVKKMTLDYVVITSVTRDDLLDGGAEQFVQTIECIRAVCPTARIEVLVPDFRGNVQSIESVCQASPDMFNHNMETVLRLSPLVRPQANYRRSLDVLKQAAAHGLPVKSGLMLGLGESNDEVMETLHDLLLAGCTNLTLGQYLAPSSKHIPMARYVSPEEFNVWAVFAKSLGFKGVSSSPLSRSSYNADLVFKNS